MVRGVETSSGECGGSRSSPSTGVRTMGQSPSGRGGGGGGSEPDGDRVVVVVVLVVVTIVVVVEGEQC